MATQRRGSASLKSPVGIATFVSLLTPRQRKDAKGNPKGDPKFQITLVFDEDADLAKMKAEAKRVGEEKFGAKFMTMVKNGKANWPFYDNADKVDDETDERYPPFDIDGEHVGFKSGDKPGVVDADAQPLMDKSDIYSGMLARVSYRAFAYDNESKGVSFFLINVQKTDDGERLSGNPSAEDDFAEAPKGKGKPAAKTASKRSRSDVGRFALN